MAAPIDESVLNALRGVTSTQTRLPKPLLIKIYVASLKHEFNQERRMLLELVGPELQSLYDDRQIEVSSGYLLYCFVFTFPSAFSAGNLGHALWHRTTGGIAARTRSVYAT